MGKATSFSKVELFLILFLTATGFILRVWYISSVGLDHYDEGVYALSALGLTDTNPSTTLFSGQYKFSPPGYFGLVGLIYSLTGEPSDTAALMVNVVFGTLSILAVWLVARKWFGQTAGIFSATLLALNEYHIQLSRTALTDVPFAFFFILALGMIALVVHTRKMRYAILAGIIVGIAWNFKYHGWFALFIATLALIPFLWFTRGNQKALVTLFGLWITSVFFALLCFVPWALYVQSQPGGYAGLLNYQSTLIDWHGFLHKLMIQIRQQGFYEGPLSQASVPIAFVFAGLVSPMQQDKNKLRLALLAILSGMALILGVSGVAAFLSLASIYWLYKEPTSFPAWLSFAWLGVWAVMTPLYFPYARLVLPFTIATLIGSGYFVSKIITDSPVALPQANGLFTLAGGLLAIAVFSISMFLPHSSNPWRASRSMADAARGMLSYIPAGEQVIVVGEPSLAFYLQIAGRQAFARMDDPQDWLKFKDPVYFVTGVYTVRAPNLTLGVETIHDRLTLLGKFNVTPKDIRVLDDFNPNSARKYLASPDDTFSLYLYHLNGLSSQ